MFYSIIVLSILCHLDVEKSYLDLLPCIHRYCLTLLNNVRRLVIFAIQYSRKSLKVVKVLNISYVSFEYENKIYKNSNVPKFWKHLIRVTFVLACVRLQLLSDNYCPGILAHVVTSNHYVH